LVPRQPEEALDKKAVAMPVVGKQVARTPVVNKTAATKPVVAAQEAEPLKK
jgi:hypothetical protein